MSSANFCFCCYPCVSLAVKVPPQDGMDSYPSETINPV